MRITDVNQKKSCISEYITWYKQRILIAYILGLSTCLTYKRCFIYTQILKMWTYCINRKTWLPITHLYNTEATHLSCKYMGLSTCLTYRIKRCFIYTQVLKMWTDCINRKIYSPLHNCKFSSGLHQPNL